MFRPQRFLYLIPSHLKRTFNPSWILVYLFFSKLSTEILSFMSILLINPEYGRQNLDSEGINGIHEINK